jgi:hypothetical protein
VICCAEADAEKLQAVKIDLEAEGHLVEVIAGVESDTAPLSAVIDRCHGEGLYVLCRSKSLSREVVDKCRDILLAQHVPFGRTLTVASIRPRELKDRIRAGLQRAAAGRARRMRRVEPEGSRPIQVRNTLRGLPLNEDLPPSASKLQRRSSADPVTKPRRRATMLGVPVGDKGGGPGKVAAPSPNKLPGPPPAPPPPDHIVTDPSARIEAQPDAPSRPADRAPARVSTSADDSFEEEQVTNVNRNKSAQAKTDDFGDDEESTFTGVAPNMDATGVGPTPVGLLSTETSVGPSPAGPLSTETSVGAHPRGDYEDTLLDLPTQDSDELASAPLTNPNVPSFYDAVEAVESVQISVAEQAKAMPQPIKAEDSIGSGELIKPEDLADLDTSAPIELSASDLKSVDITQKPVPGLRTGNTAVARLSDIVRSGNTVKTKITDLVDEEETTVPSPRRVDPLAASNFGAMPSSPHATAPATPALSSGVQATASEPAEGHEKVMLAVGLGAAALIVGAVAIWMMSSDDSTDAEIVQADTAKKNETEKTSQGDDGGGDGSDAAVPNEEPEPPVSPEAGVARSPGLVRTTVMDALKSRKVRSLDVLLVTAETAGPMTHEDAEQYCRTLDVQNLGGWRLPQIGELSSLMDAQMLGRGFYWSATAADTFGDVHLSWWGRRERVVTRDKDAFVVCVRGDRVAD